MNTAALLCRRRANAHPPDLKSRPHSARFSNLILESARAVREYGPAPIISFERLDLQTWRYEQAGVISQGFFNGPPNPGNVVLQGSGKWRDAYWELSRATFDGVNGPGGGQALGRFEMDNPGIHISRVRYAVIRPCGTNAGVNLLDSKGKLAAAADTNSLVRLSWPYIAPQNQLQSVGALGAVWTNFPGTPAVEGGGETNVLRITNSPDASFFRLIIPPAP